MIKYAIKKLLDAANVTALPVRIGRKPKGVGYPCAIIHSISSQHQIEEQGINATQSRLIQVDCWASNPEDAVSLAKAVHAVLDGYKGVAPEGSYISGCFPSGDVDLDDEELQKTGIAVDFNVWFVPGDFFSPPLSPP